MAVRVVSPCRRAKAWIGRQVVMVSICGKYALPGSNEFIGHVVIIVALLRGRQIRLCSLINRVFVHRF
jgi:NADH:ubiquinone oxidoreductase subunit 4 (subunit M)